VKNSAGKLRRKRSVVRYPLSTPGTGSVDGATAGTIGEAPLDNEPDGEVPDGGVALATVAALGGRDGGEDGDAAAAAHCLFLPRRAAAT
jgi:hypothetical protein